MSTYGPIKQQGIAFIIVLVILTALTMLTVTSMRSVNLEASMTAAYIEAAYLENLTNAALREAEFRLYGPAYLNDKLEPNIERNCIKDNRLSSNGENRPCLLLNMSPQELKDFFTTPISFFKQNSVYSKQYSYKTSKTIQVADDRATLAWMPYRGLDPNPNNYVVPLNNKHAYWNIYRITTDTADNEAINPEYGATLKGKGTFFYLVSAQAEDTVAAQSTVAMVYLGLNN